MGAEREKCLQCAREALVKTIERNNGICEACASGNYDREDSVELRPIVQISIMAFIWGLPLIIAGYVFYRCQQADYHTFWSLVYAGFVFTFSSQVFEYLLSVISWILDKSNLVPESKLLKAKKDKEPGE